MMRTENIHLAEWSNGITSPESQFPQAPKNSVERPRRAERLKRFHGEGLSIVRDKITQATTSESVKIFAIDALMFAYGNRYCQESPESFTNCTHAYIDKKIIAPAMLLHEQAVQAAGKASRDRDIRESARDLKSALEAKHILSQSIEYLFE